MLLPLLHEALSNYLVVDHVSHSKFDVSSSPKEKFAHSQVRRTRGPRLNHPVYSSIGQEIALQDMAKSCVFEIINLFSNPNISAKTVLIHMAYTKI
jgi:hypothetical protein